MLKHAGLLSLAALTLTITAGARNSAAAPPPSSRTPAELTISPGYRVIGDIYGDYVDLQQGVKCGFNIYSNDFLFNPQDSPYRPPRNAWVDLSERVFAVPDGCPVPAGPLSLSTTMQQVQYLNVHEAHLVQGIEQKAAQFNLPDGILRFGRFPDNSGTCLSKPVMVQRTGAHSWLVTPQDPPTAELVQQIHGTSQVVAVFNVPFQLQITEPGSS
jgi:hypothetical protein